MPDEIVLPERPLDALERLLDMLADPPGWVARLPDEYRELAVFRPLLEMPPDLARIRSRLVEAGRAQIAAAREAGAQTLAVRIPITDEVRQFVRANESRIRLAKGFYVRGMLPKELIQVLELYFEGWEGMMRGVAAHPAR